VIRRAGKSHGPGRTFSRLSRRPEKIRKSPPACSFCPGTYAAAIEETSKRSRAKAVGRGARTCGWFWLTRTCAVLERIEDSDGEMRKIPLVAGRHGEAMHSCCGGDHSILGKNRRVAVDQSCIFAKTGSVHGEDLRGSFQIPGPYLDLISLRGILASGDLDAFLDLSEGDRGEETLADLEALKPGQYARVRLSLAHLGDHVGIDEIACQFALLEYRGFARPHRPTLRDAEIEARTLTEEDIFPREAPLVVDFLPLFERDHDGGINTSTCHNLWPFLERILDQFAKTRFGVL